MSGHVKRIASSFDSCSRCKSADHRNLRHGLELADMVSSSSYAPPVAAGTLRYSPHRFGKSCACCHG
eukprot:scaffold7987_cov200-Cylindrotheca_fusiformis.AAC.8